MNQNKKNQKGVVEWLGSERLVDGFFTVDAITLRHELIAGGMTPPIKRFLLRRPDAVCAVVVNTDRQVMYFVRQFRVGPASKGDNAWMTELAAGLVDERESCEAAVLREVAEELGFQATSASEITMIYTSAAIISERIYIYYIEVTDDQRVSDGGGIPTEHEDLEIIEVELSDLQRFRSEADLADCKTQIGLDWYLRVKAN
jgi:ADP-ribose pyrophosphatase